MTAERTLIDAMAKALYEYDEDFERKDAPESSKTNCRRYAEVILRALHDHGPTPAMLRRAVECRHGPATYKAVPKPATDAYEQEAADDFRAMLAAELEERADG